MGWDCSWAGLGRTVDQDTLLTLFYVSWNSQPETGARKGAFKEDPVRKMILVG